MKALIEAGQSFELIVIDPPSFARRQSEVGAATKAYGRLARLGLQLLEPDGVIVLASCSSRISMDDFVALNQRAGRDQGRPLRLFERSEHALDHPVNFAEGAYLKCLFAQA